MLFLLEDACGRTMLPRRPTEALWEAGSAGRLSSRLWELALQANCFTRLLSRAGPAPTGKPRIEIHVRSPGKRSAPGASCSIHRPAQPASHRNNPSRASALQPIRGLGQCSSCWRTLAGERCCRAARPKPCGRPAPPGDSVCDCGSLPGKRTASPDFFRGQGPLPQVKPRIETQGLWELALQANCFRRLYSRAGPAPTGKPRIEIHVRSPGKRSAPGALPPAKNNPGAREALTRATNSRCGGPAT